MKNKLLVLLLGATFSSLSLAVPIELEMGVVTPITGSEEGDCSILSETVRVGLSANVRGVVECNVDDNITAIATCHVAGRKAFQASLTDATSGEVTPTAVTAGIIFTSSSQGGKLGVVEGDGCADNAGLTTAADAAATLNVDGGGEGG